MGFFDDVQAQLNRGVAATGRAAQTVKLKTQMSEALKRRQQLAAQLGASLYEVTRDNEELRAGREALYDGIAAIDAEREECQAQIDAIERESAEQAQAATSIECPFCHSRMSASDLFCSGCGKPMAEVQAALAAAAPAAPTEAPIPAPAADGPVCPSCGAPVSEGDAFCMSCGHKLN